MAKRVNWVCRGCGVGFADRDKYLAHRRKFGKLETNDRLRKYNSEKDLDKRKRMFNP